MPCNPDPGRTSAADRGSTLVEVMAAAAILGAVVLCLANLWAAFDRLSFDLLLRQKAVLVLNGETERLVALYAGTPLGSRTGFATVPTTSGYPVLQGYTGSEGRESFPASATGIDLATSVPAFRAGPDAAVLVSGSGQLLRNYVWLDRARDLVAQLSWLECAIDANTVADCWSGTLRGKKPKHKKGTPYACAAFDGGGGTDSCRLIVVIVEYPFSLAAGSPEPRAARPLTVSTIVGRRS